MDRLEPNQNVTIIDSSGRTWAGYLYAVTQPLDIGSALTYQGAIHFVEVPHTRPWMEQPPPPNFIRQMREQGRPDDNDRAVRAVEDRAGI